MILAIITIASGCASSPIYHKYVKSGQVVKVGGNDVMVFIYGSTETGESVYRLDTMGPLSINEIKEQHYALTTVSNGEIKKHDMLELSGN